MVAQVNEIARQIASVNDRIAIAQGTGHTPNDLLDQRDRLLSDLSSHVQITTVAADDGSVSVFVGGGQRLVLGGQASQLQVAADPYDASRVALGIQDGASVRPLSAALVGGGSIGGLLRFQDEDLVRARTMLGQLGAAITGSLNTQQSLGLDLGVPPGAGAPMFSIGAPQALPAETNARTAGGAFVSSGDADHRRRIAVARQRVRPGQQRVGLAADATARRLHADRGRRPGGRWLSNRPWHAAAGRDRSFPAAAGDTRGQRVGTRAGRSARHRGGLTGHRHGRRQQHRQRDRGQPQRGEPDGRIRTRPRPSRSRRAAAPTTGSCATARPMRWCPAAPARGSLDSRSH